MERCALLLHHRRHAYVTSRAWWCRPFGSLFQLSQCFSRRVFLFPLLTSTELLAHGRTSNIGFGVRVLIPCNWRVLLAISHERFSTSICPPARKTEPIEPTAARAHKRKKHSCPPRNFEKLKSFNSAGGPSWRESQTLPFPVLRIFSFALMQSSGADPTWSPEGTRIGVLPSSLNRQDKSLTMQLLRRSAQRQAAV